MNTAVISSEQIRRYRFSKEIIRAVWDSARLDNWHGPLELVEHWFVILVFVSLSLWAWQELSLALALLVYLVAVFCIGGRQRALAGVLHQACHGTLMSNPGLARLIGTLFAGYLVLQSFTAYRSSHMRGHHAQLGNPQRDPDYAQYQAYGLCGENLTQEALRRHLLRPSACARRSST